MEHYEPSRAEQARRRMIIEQTRQMLFSKLKIETMDEMSLMTRYRVFGKVKVQKRRTKSA